MDHPKRQIPKVIHDLCNGSPTDQRNALHTYFLPYSSFGHPLCRVPSFSHVYIPLLGEVNSRWVIWMIYRWYKILSPRILLSVQCGEFNQETSTLFVEIQQVFTLFFIYSANVHLTTKLHLVCAKEDSKYYIRHQEDLYQTNEFVKFFWPGGSTLVGFGQLFATFMCILGALTLVPITWYSQRCSNKANGVQRRF